MIAQHQKSPIQLHIDHELWLNELGFYKEELKVLDKYLLEAAGKNNSKEFSLELEHYQNQLVRQKDVLDELLHDIRLHEQELVKKIQEVNEIQAQKMKLDDHEEARDRVDMYKKLYAEFKHSLLAFIGKWM
ncbi:hypothetical protein KJS94_07295 [Flavihumibacter rivuli]|uniref:hypothetical protein n=1 Tax=Flavihumibacter rivuli TaxID=2838156 RepID=UPI001BDF3557|nr:hypothetical protein [Flavihumibacter rivuli]ULQ58005.1 hypothetical protein KJS94_07295 [Flavihumibacter rivuli]